MARVGLSQVLLLVGLILLCVINVTNQSLARNDENLQRGAASSLRRRPLLRHKRQAPVITDRQQLFDEIKGYQKLDMVFALERSATWHDFRRNFELEQKKFVRNMIRNFLLVNETTTRIAVITYGADVTVIFDGITLQTTMNKCDVIGSDFLWNQVKYVDGPSAHGVNISGVFKVASEILSRGRTARPGARSSLILLTSANYQPFEVASLPEIRHRNWFDVYGVGVEDFVDKSRLSDVTRNSHTNVVGSILEWQQTMRAAMETSHAIAGVGPQWERYSGSACQCPQGSSCYCDIKTGFTRCSCPGGYLDERLNCIRPCDTNICPSPEYNCKSAFDGIHYECGCNPFAGCDVRRVIDCPTDACLNGGTCFDGENQYACVCPPGFNGAHCEINEDECRDNCPGQTCQDGVNIYTCGNGNRPIIPTQPPPRPPTPRFIPSTIPPWWNSQPPIMRTNPSGGQKESTVYKAVSTDSPVEVSFLQSLSSDHRLMLTVIPPAGLGLIVLIIGIGTLIYVMRKKDRGSNGDLSVVTENTSVASHNPSLMTFDSKCYKDEGTPGPPKMSKAAEAEESKRVSYGEFDDMIYGNEALQNGMEEWYSYVLDLYHHQGLSRILIVRLDGEKWVLSPGSKLYMDEIQTLFNLMSKKITAGSFKVQGREFGIVGNNDFVIMAHTFRNSKRSQEILCATKTRQFVIIGTSEFSADNGRCKQKVLELRDHIKVQGL